MQFLDYLGTDLTTALGWTFLHSIWQGGLVALLMFLLLQVIPLKRAVLRYNVAALSMVSILGAAILTFVLVYSASDAITTALPAAHLTESTAVTQAFVTSASPLKAFLIDHLPFFVSLWLLGMLVFASKLALGMLYVRRMRNSMQSLARSWQERLGKLSRRIGYTGMIEVAESTLVKVPVAFGYFKPVILFPIGTINQLSPDQVEAILAHELAHIARRDYLQNFIQSVIEVIFYYHPAVWLISAVVRNERENCCDDLAIQACGNSLTYARALVELEEMQLQHPVLTLAFSGNRNQLLHRIKRILNQPHHKSNIMEKLITTLLLLCCIFLFSFNYSSDPSATSDRPELVVEEAEITVQLTVTDDLSLTAELDTLPKKGTIRIKKTTDDKSVEMTVKNGEIKELKIDGEEIPESEYDRYSTLIEELEDDLELPPPPPPAPPVPEISDLVVPDAPPPPPAPEIEIEIEEGPDNPLQIAPPPPPPPPPFPDIRIEKESKIIKKKDEDGNTVITIEGHDWDDAEVIIDQAGDVVFIDGERIEGDTVIIIEEIIKDHPVWHFPHGENLVIRADSMVKALKGWSFDDKSIFEFDGDQGAYFFELDSLIRRTPGNLFYFDDSKDFGNAWKQYGKAWELHQDFDMSEYQEQLNEYLEKLHDGDNEFFKQYEDILIRPKDLDDKSMKKLEKYFNDGDFPRRFEWNDGENQNFRFDHDFFFHAPNGEFFGRKDNDVRRFFEQKLPSEAIIDELVRQGVITDANNYTVVLTANKLKVNGKKMSEALHARISKIYEDSGRKLSEKTRIEIKNRDSDGASGFRI